MTRLLAVVMLLWAGPALALSCLPPDVGAAFKDAEESEDPYRVVLGTISGGPKRAMKARDPVADKTRSYRAHFKGHWVGRNGPSQELDVKIKVVERCIGTWCPVPLQDEKMLTFMRVAEGETPEIVVNACYYGVFLNPTKAQMDAVRACFRGRCPKAF